MKFAPLVRCPGWPADWHCVTLIDEKARPLCTWCKRRKEGRDEPERRATRGDRGRV